MADSAPKIVLGVTGSIAAWKALDVLRLLQKAGCDVWPVLTACAAQYVGPLPFRSLSRHPVPVGPFASLDPDTYQHIGLADGAAAFLVAPCTANTMARLAHGFADDVLSAAALALDPSVPLLLAPAMNTRMWQHPATQANRRTLLDRGVHFIDPDVGPLACGETGPGRLAEPAAIADATLRAIGRAP
jgi:phosphopantothenoylcysteine decarboxylase/phosphopantothenate--cysteine ligase